MTIESRVAKLETKKIDQVVIISMYVEPDGKPSPVEGYTLPNGDKLMRHANESVEALQYRAEETAKQITRMPIHLQPTFDDHS